MKKTFLLFIIGEPYSSISFCQSKISIDSLNNYVGEKVTVCNKVYGTKFLDQDGKQPTFLDVGGAYPDNPLTVVIFGDERKNFKEPPEVMYAGKEICVTGEIKEFKEKPEIIIENPDEIIIGK